MGLIGGAGYQLEPEAFEQLTKGIRAATAELKELGFDVEAQQGRGFDRLSLDGVECGDDGLAAVLDTFCERWGWGVRTLMQDANGFSKKLGITAGFYYEQEQYASDTLKTVVSDAVGNPAATTEQLHKKSWADVADPLKDADWDPTSAASRAAGRRSVQTAEGLGHDITSIPDRMTGDDPAGSKGGADK
ncbi:hypothetical protein [Streptomyces pinistramenti]|uniref:hypothetical protein n=1 Tax=Streptomyces pinistramenti TaxID=2884812 RepID=UPI001D08A4B7|nr:hypothetical protein [Streptomyces pinistramenti]MCB5912013.1 hypothetical protein [Streptomyces pinistramenti]